MSNEPAVTIAEHETQQVERANATEKQPVVFVHGLWLLPSSWDRWAKVFEDAGFTALTPGWPDDPETVEEANAHPEVMAHQTVGQVADHFDAVLRTLRHPRLRGPACAGPARARTGRGPRSRQSGSLPRRAAAADLGAEVRVAGS